MGKVVVWAECPKPQASRQSWLLCYLLFFLDFPVAGPCFFGSASARPSARRLWLPAPRVRGKVAFQLEADHHGFVGLGKLDGSGVHPITWPSDSLLTAAPGGVVSIQSRPGMLDRGTDVRRGSAVLRGAAGDSFGGGAVAGGVLRWPRGREPYNHCQAKAALIAVQELPRTLTVVPNMTADCIALSTCVQ